MKLPLLKQWKHKIYSLALLAPVTAAVPGSVPTHLGPNSYRPSLPDHHCGRPYISNHTVTPRVPIHTTILWCKDSEQTSGAEWNGSWILDRKELQLSLVAAIQLFKSILCYSTYNQLQHLFRPMCNALTVLLLSQRQLTLSGLPASVIVCTNRDKLPKEENIPFPAAEVDSSGKNFVKEMVGCLWYVDGHHETLKSNLLCSRLLCKILWFSGYNLPQLSMHSPRQITNLSSPMFKSLASSLLQNHQVSLWSDTSFQCLRQHTLILAQSLANNSDHLSSHQLTQDGMSTFKVLRRVDCLTR